MDASRRWVASVTRLRPPINGAWRNQSFRSYADYMQTPEFATGIDELVAIANTQVVAVMCAEAVPWRCHRSLIADALLARHIAVDHIISATDTRPHRMTDFARTRGQRVRHHRIAGAGVAHRHARPLVTRA